MIFKLALVTGASSGLGYAFSQRLDQEGIPQIIVGRNSKKLEEIAEHHKHPVEIVIADLSTEEGMTRVAEVVNDRAPDLVVNNAGVGLYGAVTDLSVEAQRNLVRLNSEAPMLITIEAIKALQREKSKGCILNISSVAAYLPFPYFAVYAASKAFLNSFTESVAAELNGDAIALLLACPGPIDTEFRDRASGGRDQGAGRERSMTVDFAVEQLWSQVEKRQPVSVFSASYRILLWLCRNVLPKKMVNNVLKRSIRQRIE